MVPVVHFRIEHGANPVSFGVSLAMALIVGIPPARSTRFARFSSPMPPSTFGVTVTLVSLDQDQNRQGPALASSASRDGFRLAVQFVHQGKAVTRCQQDFRGHPRHGDGAVLAG